MFVSVNQPQKKTSSRLLTLTHCNNWQIYIAKNETLKRVVPGAFSEIIETNCLSKNTMFPADYPRCSDRQSNHYLPRGGPFASLMGGESDVFDTFLDEFTEGRSLVARDLREDTNGEKVDGGRASGEDPSGEQVDDEERADGGQANVEQVNEEQAKREQENVEQLNDERAKRFQAIVERYNGEEDKDDEDSRDRDRGALEAKSEEEDKGETADRPNSAAPSSSRAPTAERDNQGTRFDVSLETAELLLGFPCGAVTGEAEEMFNLPRLHDVDATTACRNIGHAPVRGKSTAQMIISFSCVRSLTNPTYLRRLNLSRKDAINLFPQAQSTMNSAFAKNARPCESPRKFWKSSTSVGIQDPEGRLWPVVLVCLRTASQRHVKLTRGWAETCSANGFCVGMIVRLDRWEEAPPSEPSREALVTVSIV